jgi:hypothetical protein
MHGTLSFFIVRLAGIVSIVMVGYHFQAISAFAQSSKALALPITERFRINGKLDEAAWSSASTIGALIQVLPREGTEASERTDVRVLVDGDAIYFGVTCYDRKPSGIISTQLIRDTDLKVDDSISVVLDPFFDQRNGFYFQINPSGARADGQISNSAEEVGLDWDGIWNAHARITNAATFRPLTGAPSSFSTPSVFNIWDRRLAKQLSEEH